MNTSEKILIFEEAFSTCTGGSRRTCECGKTYYDTYNRCDWEEGELEKLKENGAIPIDHSIGDISFEGKMIVNTCDCWHKRAEQIMRFLDSHKDGIAKYFKLQKIRKQKMAEDAPEIET